MSEYTANYDKWRMKLMHTCLLLAILVIVAELVMFFVLFATGFILSSPALYFLKYLLIPLVINLSAVGLGYLILSIRNVSEALKTYVPIVVLGVICLCISCVHYIFPTITCSFCFPVILTAVYGQFKITRNTAVACEVCLIVATLYAYFHIEDPTFFIIYDSVIVGLLIFAIAIVTAVLVNYDSEKRRLLKNSVSKQGMLKEQLLHDPMTGLYNHKGFYNRLDIMTENVRIQGALAVIDIDDFKKLNDTWGHDKGDIVLTQFAYILKSCCGHMGIPARYGGEEFAVIFPGVSMQEAVEKMEEILYKFNNHPFDFLENQRVGFSCGVALYLNGMTSKELFSCADQAMYQAKSQGKNKVLVYYPKH